MAYSFYGGKEGISFLIKKSYQSIQEMYDCFSQGMSYNEVGFGEFVIISTRNKADFENGSVYRRGFDSGQAKADCPDKQTDIKAKIVEDIDNPNIKTTNPYPNARKYWKDRYHLITDPGTGNIIVDPNRINERVTIEFLSTDYEDDVYNYLNNPGGGAKYIGNISGPEGAAAAIELITWKDTEVSIDFDRVFNSGQAEEGEQGEIELSRSNGKNVDVAKAGYCTIRDGNGQVIHSYMSFDLPVDVFEVQAESANPYGPIIIESSIRPVSGTPDVYYKVNGSTGSVTYLYENGEWIEREPWTATYNPETHQWDYTGLIREKEESEGHPYYHSYDLKIPTGIHGQDINNIGIRVNGSRMPMHDVDTSNHNYELYYEKTNYNAAEPVTEREYTGAIFKTIDGIERNDKTGNYDDRENSHEYAAGQIIDPHVQGILLLCSKGGISAAAAPSIYNQLTVESIGGQFQDGEVIWTVIKDDPVPFNKMIIYYTDGSHTQIDARLLEALEVDDDGRMYAKYSDLNHRNYLTTNKQILGIDANNNIDLTKLKVKYNTYKYKINDKEEDGKHIGDLVLDIDDTFKYYNGSTIPISTTMPIAGITPDVYPTTDSEGREIQYLTDLSSNDIIDMQIVNCELYVLYSDPERREHLKNPKRLDYHGKSYLWEDLGHLMEGDYVFGNFESLGQLVSRYPYGLGRTDTGEIIPTEEAYIGWLVTVDESQEGALVHNYYAYNYAVKDPQTGKGEWYRVEQIKGTKPENIFLIAQQANGTIAPVGGDSKLFDGGIWFVVTP